eukprot:scaffold31792_cov168-Amphora_coffeaeformis.AAC.13
MMHDSTPPTKYNATTPNQPLSKTNGTIMIYSHLSSETIFSWAALHGARGDGPSLVWYGMVLCQNGWAQWYVQQQYGMIVHNLNDPRSTRRLHAFLTRGRKTRETERLRPIFIVSQYSQH